MGWKKDGQKGCKIDGNEGALMNKMQEMEGKGMDGKCVDN